MNSSGNSASSVITLDPVTQYAGDVVAGRILAGHFVKRACRRHLQDLKRQGSEKLPFVFKPELAERAFRFFKHLRFIDGPAETIGRPITLHGFQYFIIGSLFGWVHMETGHRRFKKAYIQLGRKNGKSLLVSGIGLYMLMVDGWFGAQVYTTATHREQAKIVWEGAAAMAEASPLLMKRLKIHRSRSEILFRKQNGKFLPLSKDTKHLDGFNPHCGIVDEYHQHDTNQMVKLLQDGTVQQTQALILIITTAGFNLNAPCYDEYNYCCKVMDEVLDNEEYFVYIAQLDKTDKPFAEKNWIKANPLVAATELGMRNLRALAKEAQDKQGDDLRDFLTKNLNFWVDQKADGYMSVEKWNKATVKKLPDLAGRECYVGLDLSSKIDLTSVGFEFPLGDERYAVISHSFMPADTLEHKRKTDKVPYDDWVRKGYITKTPGAVIDYRFVGQFIKDLARKNGWVIREICYDPYNATQLAQELEAEGYVMVEVRQGYQTLSEPTKSFRELAYAKKLEHLDDPLLRFAVSNAVLRKDHNNNIMLDKGKATERIDPVACLINAHVRAMVHEPEGVLYFAVEGGST